MDDELTPAKPYLARAIYEWLSDNGLTPYVAVDVTVPNVMVPMQYSKANKIILNISHTATTELHIDNEALTCAARFGGVKHNLYIPIAAILAIYAQENNRGMVFQAEEGQARPATPKISVASTSEAKKTTKKTTKKKPPKLTVVDGGKES